MQWRKQPETLCLRTGICAGQQHASIKHHIKTALLYKCNSDHYTSTWKITCCSPPGSALFISHEEKKKDYMNINHSLKLLISRSTLKFISDCLNIKFCPKCSDMGLSWCCDTWLAGVTRVRQQSKEGSYVGAAPSWLIGDAGWGRWLIDWGWLGDKQCSGLAHQGAALSVTIIPDCLCPLPPPSHPLPLSTSPSPPLGIHTVL